MPAAIPLISLGASVGKGLMDSRKAGQQQKALQQQAGVPMGQGNQLFNTGMPQIQQAGSYYANLLNGSRAQMTQAVSPEIGAIGDVYRGAERGLERSGVQGAQRSVAQAELGRERAGKIAGLIGGVRPAAADALGKLGMGAVGNATEFQRTSGYLQGQAQDVREYNDKQSEALWGNIGKLGVGMWDVWKNRKGAGVIGAGDTGAG